MEWHELITGSFGRVLWILEKALDGLTPEDLNQQPQPHCNSIGWLTWHLTRWQDHAIASFMGEKQLWVSDGWYAKFDREPDPEDTGKGHSLEDVAAFKSPDAEILLGYYSAVLNRTGRYLASLAAIELDRQLNDQWYGSELWYQSKRWHQDKSRRQGLPLLGIRLGSVVSDNIQHAGQVAYLRGMLKGEGWYGA